ncbi:TIGR02679 family protein [Spirillospora sp. NBC_01491]|uniref:TIGR02679 family protein n=1 Tax=Spirillospora sp. NBC_01491 TaxID=2976007 RepID=UPI002E2FB79E|nr:TIGR02679 family protein [Spirillospora sp. NBC_01491]
MRPQTRAWLGQPALERFWRGVHERLERNGMQAKGRLSLKDVSDQERDAVALLMGRPYTGPALSIALAELDGQLRSSAAERGLIEVVVELRGPLTDRPALRDKRRAASETVWGSARRALHERGLDGLGWVVTWLDDVRRGGALARLDPDQGARLIVQAVEALAGVRPVREPAVTGRGELAERITGTAHGLDDGTLLARIVLRGLACAHDAEPPRDAWARRALWEAAGVTADQVSSTVLTYGLMPMGEDRTARHLRERSLDGAETHLTLRDLRDASWRLPEGLEVYICENPRIVEVAAGLRCPRPLVCASGNPTTVVLTLLDGLVSAGARLAYRGDFDWPGIAMANRMIGRYGARPWRLGAADYEEQVAAARSRGTPLQPLAGTPVAAGWDPELTPTMQALNAGVQEESALELLIDDLR